VIDTLTTDIVDQLELVDDTIKALWQAERERT
jgi:hypothetical protein